MNQSSKRTPAWGQAAEFADLAADLEQFVAKLQIDKDGIRPLDDPHRRELLQRLFAQVAELEPLLDRLDVKRRCAVADGDEMAAPYARLHAALSALVEAARVTALLASAGQA